LNVFFSVFLAAIVVGLYGSSIYDYIYNLPITTNVVSLNPAQAKFTQYNIM
jgi:hypothetical protein